MSRKTIVISEDGMFGSEAMSFNDVLQLTCSCVAGVAKDILTRAKESEDFEEIRGELFDAANLSFSHCLEVSFPDKELRPDLTEEAILKAENEILAERAADIEPDAGEPGKIVPFPATGTVTAGHKSHVEGDCEPCGDDTQN